MIRIEYDDQPNDVVEKFRMELKRFGLKVIQDGEGDGYVCFEIESSEFDYV